MSNTQQPPEARGQAPGYPGPEWMGPANWHSVAETYLLKVLIKPGMFVAARLALSINRRFPRLLLNRSYDGLERLIGWLPGVPGTRTERVRLAHCPAEWTWNVDNPPGPHGPFVIYFHGSAFISLGINSHRPLVSRIAREAGARVLSVGYRLCPRNQVEDGIADGVEAYRFLLEQGIDPGDIVLAGDSAGGFMATMTAVAVRDQGLPLPAGCALLSAVTSNDLTLKYVVEEGISDAIFPVAFLGTIGEVFLLRNGGREPGPCPADADLSGLGPFLLQAGSQETLRQETELLGERLAQAGVPVRVQIFDRAVHVFQIFAFSNPDARRAVAEIANFIGQVAGAERRRGVPQPDRD